MSETSQPVTFRMTQVTPMGSGDSVPDGDTSPVGRIGAGDHAHAHVPDSGLAALVQSLDDVIWYGDLKEHRLLFVNDAVTPLTGWTAADFVRDPSLWSRMVEPADRAVFRRLRRELARDGATMLEYRIRRRDGSLRWVQDRRSIIRDADGRKSCVGGIISDISARKVTEQAVGVSWQFVEKVTSTVPCILFVWDCEHSCVSYINAQVTDQLGYPLEKALSIDAAALEQLVHPGDWQAVVHVINQITGKPAKRVADAELRLRHSDGSWRWGHLRASAFGVTKNGRVHTIVGSLEDMTQTMELRRRIEEATEAEQRQIGLELHERLGQQMASIGMLATSLRNKLAAAESPQASSAAVLTKYIQEAAGHLEQVARVLLPVEIHADGLRAALEEMAGNVQKLFGVHCRFIGPQPVLLSDNGTATQLYRIAHEAAHDAVKHAGAKHIIIRLESVFGQILLSITDDGRSNAHVSRQSHGMTLHMMQHRAAVIGARLSIHTDPHWTTITCSIEENSCPEK